MNKQSTINIFFIVISGLAVLAGVWGFLIGSGATVLLITAVVLLVAAQLLLFFTLYRNKNQRPASKPDTNQLLKAVAKMNKRLGRIETKMSELAQIPSPSPQQAPLLDSHDSEMKPAGPVLVDEVSQRPVLETPTSFDGPAYLNDSKLSLYLEPVVDIADLSTAFYRAEMAFQSETGERVKTTQMANQIEKAGHASAMDMKLFTRLGPVIDRLAARGTVLGVICPMSRHSFANEEFLSELTSYLQHYPNLAQVVIIDIGQADLAGLSDDGMAGLAFLAQAGATFCLGGAGLESPDLVSLASLGFRYLDLDFSDNIARYGWEAFAAGGPASELHEIANAQNIKIIGSGLLRKSQYNALNNFIHFGRGETFSPPRLVRTDLSQNQFSDKAA